MTSITLFVLCALAAGFFLAFKIARISSGNGALKFVGSAFFAVILGICLTFAVVLSHALCEGLLKVCTPTTSYDVVYPFMAVPLYWIVMLITPSSTIPKVDQ